MLEFNGMVSATLSEQLKATPTQPGVYLLKDAQGEVLYVGKASSLRHRLQSYFGSPANMETKIRHLVSRVRDFEFIVTESEAEALILENTFTSIGDMVDKLMPMVAFFKKFIQRIFYPTIDRIGKVNTPILFIRGIKDEIVPADHT